MKQTPIVNRWGASCIPDTAINVWSGITCARSARMTHGQLSKCHDRACYNYVSTIIYQTPTWKSKHL